MNAMLLFCLLGVNQLTAEYLFFPGNPELHNTKLEIPGVLVNKKHSLTVVPEDESDPDLGVEKSFPDAESRKILGLPLAAAAAAATSIKAATSLNAASSNAASSLSAAASPIVTFQADTAINAAAPLCLACTCKLGRTTCSEAGGIAVYTAGEPAFGDGAGITCSAVSPCVFPAPDTMSACDPRCRKMTATCNPTRAAIDCKERPAAVACGTDCQDRLPGEKVVCDNRAIARSIMNGVPMDVCSVFGHVNRHGASADHRQGRFFGNSFFARLIPSPASTVRVPGSAVLSYAPTGRCIPMEIAHAPYCNKLV